MVELMTATAFAPVRMGVEHGTPLRRTRAEGRSAKPTDFAVWSVRAQDAVESGIRLSAGGSSS